MFDDWRVAFDTFHDMLHGAESLHFAVFMAQFGSQIFHCGASGIDIPSCFFGWIKTLPRKL